MLRWLIVLTAFTSLTGFAWLASARGYGLPGLLTTPVSIRQSSTASRSGRGPMFIYFGGRRHSSGGFRGGK